MYDRQQLKEEFAELSNFLVALGDEKRQLIIIALLEDNACKGLQVNDLTEAVQLSRPAVSHHLKLLRQVGLVEYKSEGTKNFYYLSHDLEAINQLKHLLEHVATVAKRGKTS